ncbi:MAG: VWA domain-containing protein [Verrucomicrobiota bacterium]
MEKKSILWMLAFGAITLLSGYSSHALGATGAIVLKTAVDRPLVHRVAEDQKVVVKIELEGERREAKNRIPLNLAIVLDRSGSMSGRKLEQAKQAAEMLIDQMDAKDVFSLILYESEVEVLAPAAPLGDRRSQLKRLIRKIETGGSTALYDGVRMGGKQLDEYLSRERINRVVLLSDGIANVGPSSNREIAKLGSRLAKGGVSVTTVGLGDDYNETLMTALAEASDANYYYVADVEQLPEVFQSELGELKTVVAREVVIEVTCPEGVRPLRFLGRPGSLNSQHETITFSTISSEQSRELYLECLIDKDYVGDVSEIAEVEVIFSNVETTEREVAGAHAVMVSYTNDKLLAENAVDRAIAAEAVVFANAEETERSIALADEGNIEACRKNIEVQKAALSEAYALAPAAQQVLIKEEIAALEETEVDLQNDALSKEQRKKLSSGSWMTRNSKR